MTLCRYLGTVNHESAASKHGGVSLTTLPAQCHFPLCMQTLMAQVKQDHHLRQTSRQQLSLFLKVRFALHSSGLFPIVSHKTISLFALSHVPDVASCCELKPQTCICSLLGNSLAADACTQMKLAQGSTVIQCSISSP
jgi:hypothetical protein